MKNRKLQASYTLEATLIMSVLLFIIFALMYMAFYLHDISKIQGVLDISSMKTSISLKHEGNFITGEPFYTKINERDIFNMFSKDYSTNIAIAKNYIEDELKGTLIIGEIKKVEITINESNITTYLQVQMKFPFEEVKKYFTSMGTMISLSSKACRHNPAEFIRRVDTIEDILTKANN